MIGDANATANSQYGIQELPFFPSIVSKNFLTCSFDSVIVRGIDFLSSLTRNAAGHVAL